MGRPIDLVSFGKVEQISIKGDDVTVRLLEDPMCYFVRPILKSAEDVLLAIPGINHVHFEFSTTTLWTPELMRTGAATPQSR
jgi:metal-sulfur cluster biosynthetic enzyme